ncbi:MAG: ImmA/IrrE family metallo-endopeptidase [Magnetococcales bacterium]|nr:ImmA/IrrE family metallo-endopeptidase [Magnetococcales bacterium]
MSKALINPQMLRWARERAALSADELAKKIPTRVDRLATWENGTDRPTFKQAETVAQKTHIPFGYLFLPQPPQEELPIPDLRTQGGWPQEQPSPDFFDLIQNVVFQQDWYREYLTEQGRDPLPFVGKFRMKDGFQTIAQDIRTTLGMDDHPMAPDRKKYLELLCDRCEEAGLWIMRAGFVGSNTHRTLNVDEFRGFAITDPLVPLIFINGRDAKAAQIFTLAHELAHIWLGESGISNIRLNEAPSPRKTGIEPFCNKVAAEFLTPRNQFLSNWLDERSLEENLDTLSRIFRVSDIVIARRAADLGRITQEQYQIFFQQEQKRWREENRKIKANKGGDHYKTKPIMNGCRFTRAVLADTMSGRLLLREAGRLLHMSPATVQKLFLKNKQEKF